MCTPETPSSYESIMARLLHHHTYCRALEPHGECSWASGRVGGSKALDCLLLWHLSQVQLGEPYVVLVARTYGNTKLGEFAATELLKLEPKDSDIH